MDQLLSTKFFVPQKQQSLVSRPRLLETLNNALSSKLTLLSAPAGFGKTTLVSEWVSQSAIPVAWFSLNKDDGDPKRFLLYFITALQAISEQFGDISLGILQQTNSTPSEALLTTLVNEIAQIPDHFVMVLDDFHLADSKSVDDTLSFLLEHLPPHLHLVITTREDPSLPLARLRARGQLTEIRAADLRFSLAEASDFLNSFLGVSLSEESIAALEERTEGWIVGLQLAALSLKRNKDPEAFIQSFAGSHYFVLDYLVEEVLEQQSESIQSFLLGTSILDSFCGSLCDALLPNSSKSGQANLAYLEQANLFLVPLDNERRWYRYHKLFADLLQQRLSQEGIDTNGLHARASQWYEENGFDLEAFEHAAAANDVERAERLLTGSDVPLHFRGAMQPVLNWLESLPGDIMDAKPSLWVTYASVLTVSGKPVDEIESVLQSAERAVQTLSMNAVNRDLLGQLATIHAMLGIPRNRIEDVIHQAEKALEFLGTENLADRTTAAWALGYAYQLQGRFDAAIQAHQDAHEISQKSGNLMISIATLISLGQIAERQYELHTAEGYFRQVLDLVGNPPLPPACEAYLGLARIHYEWNDLDAAQEHVEKSLPLALQMDNVDTPVNCKLLLTKLQLARRELGTASKHLGDAENFATKGHLTHKMRDVNAAKIALLLAQGNFDAAGNLAKENELLLSQAQVLLAQGDASAALKALEAVNGQGSDILQTMLIKVISLYKLGKKDEALKLLNEALKLTKNGGLLRSFVDIGDAMAGLLRNAAVQAGDQGYMLQLQQAFSAGEKVSQGTFIEPLSDRELEILKLISQGLSNREIAERLFLALDTVKGHNRRLFNKLQVQRRTEAVARARELDLL